MTEEVQTPKPGIYEDVPFEEYRQWKAVNNSSLGSALVSAAHYRAYLQKPHEDTDALRFGSLMHAGKLDPKELLQKYVVMPPFEIQLEKEYANPRNTTEYKTKKADWEAQQPPEKTIVTQQEYDLMSAMCLALEKHTLARECFDHDGPAEVSLIWRDPVTGLLCKGRIDKLDHKQTRFADLKTAKSLSNYAREIFNRAYHRQGAFYQDGLYELLGKDFTPWLVPQEKEEPYACAAAPLDPDALTIGRREYRTALKTIAEARRTGNYPLPESPATWNIPGFAYPELTLTGSRGPVTL